MMIVDTEDYDDEDIESIEVVQKSRSVVINDEISFSRDELERLIKAIDYAVRHVVED